MVGGETDRPLIVADTSQSKRTRVVYQSTEDPPPDGEVADTVSLFLRDAMGDEVLEHPVGPEHSQRAVASVRDPTRQDDDLLKEGGER